MWCSSRHRHRPATGPADSQEHAGDLDLGDGALGQVSVLPADRPRLLADLRSHGLDLSLGTLTDGLKRMVPLLEPVYEASVKRSQGQRLWHADETRWLVFVMLEGKVGYRGIPGSFIPARS